MRTARRRLVIASVFMAFSAAATGQDEYRVPQTACYEDQTITLTHSDGANDIVLAGTLSTPAGRDHLGTVLMITGSGPHTRDQMISGVPHFGLIADLLARAGFRVLRTDARGFGDSTINGQTFEESFWVQVPTTLRSYDTEYLLDHLRTHPGEGVDRLIVLGHSEGAMIAAGQAARRNDISLAILVSNSTRPGHQVISRQRADFMRREGVDEATAAAVEALLEEFGQRLSAGEFESEGAFDAFADRFLAAQAGLEEPFFGKNFLDFFRDTPWFRHFMSYDPREDLEGLRSPIAVFYGEADTHTPPDRHLPILVTALAEASVYDAGIYLLPGQDHFFLEFEGEPVSRHPYGQTRLSNEFSEALLAELSRRFGRLNVCEG